MNLRVILAGIGIIGLVVFSYSLTLPYYKNQAQYNRLLGSVGKIGKANYYRQEAELRTAKVMLMDAGAGVAEVAVILLLFLFATKVRQFSDFSKLLTISTLAVFVIANAAWLLLLPGTWWYYGFRLSRGDFPPFADSVAIPIGYQFSTLTWLFIPLSIFLLVASIGARLPAVIFQKPPAYTLPAILWELFFGCSLLVNSTLLLSFVADGDHASIVVFCVLIYLTLSLRAGRLNHA